MANCRTLLAGQKSPKTMAFGDLNGDRTGPMV